MSTARVLVLGLVAGATILFGLPIGRLRRPAPVLRLTLNAVATGILLFLVWDVLSAAYEPIGTALAQFHAHHGGLGTVAVDGLLFFTGIGTGLLSLVYYGRWMARPRFGPGAMAVGERVGGARAASAELPGRRLALLIAVGIGLHNFAEGLGIGGAAARGEIALATLLIIGFGLHNATEGFGICAPMSGGADRPSWGYLLTLGAIGGGPTFVGTLVGHSVTNVPVTIVFLTLAAGSILYVVMQLLNTAARAQRPVVLAWGLFAGLAAGFLTDFIVSAAGV